MQELVDAGPCGTVFVRSKCSTNTKELASWR
jgi:hypothetical protein